MATGDHVIDASKLLEFVLLLAKEQTKQLTEVEITKRLFYSSEVEKEKMKRMRTNYEQSSSSTIKTQESGKDYLLFYNRYVRHNIQLFNINLLLKQNNNVTDKTIDDIKTYFDLNSLDDAMNEAEVQEKFDNLINHLFVKMNDSTSLKYLNSSRQGPQSDTRPDCTFLYKNVNVNLNERLGCMQDFVVCLGELKAPNVSLNEKAIGQICSYLTDVLITQNRQNIYGFLTNFELLKFIQVQRAPNLNEYNYFQTEDFEMFNSSKKSAATSSQTKNKKSAATSSEKNNKKTTEPEKRSFNKGTWINFIRFLTMDYNFYEYELLNINPLDDLLGKQFNIRTKLGHGLTSMVYFLEKNKNNDANVDLQSCVMKISRHQGYSDQFLNEVQKIQQLSKPDPRKFSLFFENIFCSSPTGNFLCFKNKLERLQSLSLVESKQLIDIIQYLYKCRIIHRDIRPRNLMMDTSSGHLKLIDFGFAISFKNHEITKKLPIEGSITFAGLELLEFYSKSSCNSALSAGYNYERTFDLKCSINNIMYMNDSYLKKQLRSIQESTSAGEKPLKSFEIWKTVKQDNGDYLNLLNLIDEFNESTTFNDLKKKLEKLVFFRD
ncbi:unnamed protein product [Rotaria magnacalcarata]|uniref:non-specific serine/threonine protein kinase n=1 Tax=Rotaria magnacalcarata TaxID=392030 RepID=A0A815JPE6_9BILA|nr:unnamed protein product [Rotaria magnacalcarata]CAF4092677.1 unnamed protein product [Rotaria magnacalcarata]